MINRLYSTDSRRGWGRGYETDMLNFPRFVCQFQLARMTVCYLCCAAQNNCDSASSHEVRYVGEAVEIERAANVGVDRKADFSQ